MENETIQISNKYNYTFKDYVGKAVYTILSPVVSIAAKITGENTLACKSFLALGINAFLYGYSSTNIKMLSAQAVLESGGFTSPMCSNDRNIFGMHMPYVRPTTAAGSRWNATEDSQVAVYNSYYDSVLDRIQWDKYNSISPKSSIYALDVIANGYNPFESYLGDWEYTSFKLPLSVKLVCYSPLLLVIYLLIKK